VRDSDSLQTPKKVFTKEQKEAGEIVKSAFETLRKNQAAGLFNPLSKYSL
jgi:hypothetical protein